MATPALKTSAYLRELADKSRPVSRARAEWIIADCKRLLKSAATDPAVTHATLGHAYLDLERYAEALHHYRNAMRYNPEDLACKISSSAALVMLDRPQEALELLAEIGDDIDDFLKLFVLGNTAEALANLGMMDEACEAMAEALRIADHTDPAAVLMLAEQTSTIGADREAIELFARYIRLKQGSPRGNDHPLEVILSASDEEKLALTHREARPLARVVAKALSFGQALFDAGPVPPRTLPTEKLAEADAQAEAVYHETLSARRKAIEEAMAEDHHAS